MTESEILILEMDLDEQVIKINGWPPLGIPKPQREDYEEYIKKLEKDGWNLLSRVFEVGTRKEVSVKSASFKRPARGSEGK